MFSMPIPPQVIEACKHYIDYLNGKKDTVEHQLSRSIKLYTALIDNDCDEKDIPIDERLRQHEIIKKHCTSIALQEVHSIDMDITRIKEYIYFVTNGECKL